MRTNTPPTPEANARHPLDAIFVPRNIAVIGATERSPSVGHTLMTNLLEGDFGRNIFPINLKRKTVLGLKVYRNIRLVPEKVDLAVIVTPAATVPKIVQECVKAGVRGAIIISAGFKEFGPSGAKLEDRILAEAKRGRMRIIGPNCLGVMNPFSGLNATFAGAMVRPGNVGFVSQSGAFGAAILDWSLRERVGFSAFVSIGAMIDVDWGDLITYLGNDPRTRSIVIYMESIGDARSFLSAAREVALAKPIIVLKGGQTTAAAKATAAHIGAFTGRDAVSDAAFRRCGVLRVEQIAHLFYMAEVLSKQPRPQGPRLTILTNAGGPGISATDALINGGGQLAGLSAETIDALSKFLPPHWSRGNPIDILGEADPARYAQALEVAAGDTNSDGLLVILTPQDMTAPTRTAHEVKKFANQGRKPILASWMGGTDVAAGEAILNQANIPTFEYPDTAARIFNYMWQYSRNLRSLYETPTLPPDSDETAPERLRAKVIIETARRSGQTMLSELEAREVLDAYGIPAGETPLESSETAAGKGYELILESSIDPQFGPVLLFGSGGQLAHVYQDRALGLPPLTSTLARRMMEQTRIFTALQGDQGRDAVDLQALEQLLVRFSYLVVEQRWIKEIGIDPLLVSPERLVALGARVLLHPPDSEAEKLPRPAIRPYPGEYVTGWRLKDGSPVVIRPIRPEDEALMAKFHHTLSDDSVFYRFFQMMPLARRIDHDRLSRICFIDYDREIALVIDRKDTETGDRNILGVVRYIKRSGTDQAEFALVVSDHWHRQGIGFKLLESLLEVGRQEKVKRIVGTILPENAAMLALCKKLGFEIHNLFEERVIEARIDL